jgi:transcriptional regulator with XRE-family HTH domain
LRIRYDLRVDAASMLRQLRERSGLSQAELAEVSGVAQPTISLYETGRREPGADVFLALVHATGHTLDPRPIRRPMPGKQVGELLPQLLDLADAIPRRHPPEPLAFPPFASVVR